MKNRNRYLYKVWCLLALTCWGCNDFLDERSVNMVHPSTLDDMSLILFGDGYDNVNSRIYRDALLQSDILKPIETETNVAATESRDIYMWNDGMYSRAVLGKNIANANSVWYPFYQRILGCNVVLDYLDEMQGDTLTRESLRGEALALRSWIYLQLVNTFGKAWNQCDPATEPGVVLKLNSDVKYEFPSKNTVLEVYTRIEQDLLEANRLLEKHNREQNNRRIGHLAVKGMLSRMYLYEENWDESIRWADAVLAEKSALLNLNSVIDSVVVSTVANRDAVVDTLYKTEAVWSNYIALNNNGYEFSFKYAEIFGVLDFDEFKDYTDTLGMGIPESLHDLRLAGYFTRTANGYYCLTRSDGTKVEGIRTSELYLNRAEAYARKYADGDASAREKAIENLNELRKNRIIGREDLNDNPDLKDAEGLVAFCIDERMRELGGEINHRWCDLRRYGLQVTHQFELETATHDMTRQVLPVPEGVLEQNPSLLGN